MHYSESPLQPGRITSPAGDLHYVNLHGSLPAMAEELGEKLSNKMRQNNLKHLANGLETLLQTSHLAPLSFLLSEASQRLATHRLRSKLPPSVMRSLTLLADSSSVPLGTLLRAHLMPETLLWFRQTLAQTPINKSLASPISTSSICVTNPDRPLLGSNFHYMAANGWERHLTLTSYHSPRSHSYAAITTAGLLGAGHCAMNSAGITLTLHPLAIHGVNPQGAPVGLCTDAIMRSASSLEQAIDISRQCNFMTPFGLMLLEGDTGRGLIIERSPDKEHIQWLEPSHNFTTYHETPKSHALGRELIHASPSAAFAARRQHWRQQTLVEELSQHTNTVVQDIAKYLSDMSDDASEMGATQIANPGVVSSVVFEPGQRKIWVAATSSCPASRGFYLPFSLQPGSCTPDLASTPFSCNPSWTESAHGQAFEFYNQACHRLHESEPPKKLLLLLEHALAFWPHDPNLHVACGLVALKAESLNRAQGAFERALEMEKDPTRRAEISLYLAMTADLGPRTRGQAKYMYKQLAKQGATPQRVALFARKKARRRLQHDELLKIPLDLLTAGLLL